MEIITFVASAVAVTRRVPDGEAVAGQRCHRQSEKRREEASRSSRGSWIWSHRLDRGAAVVRETSGDNQSAERSKRNAGDRIGLGLEYVKGVVKIWPRKKRT
ncbi:hypothetical protein CRG98_023577 [Punica granatum]|uniref:Uncharacterized protein n=1 Tax=Punica granatum TaxID=22663 RepID=A0A2I0JIE4_PUNGR|nr:hypothetical protein CRG98_023577 [Punica granatum]